MCGGIINELNSEHEPENCLSKKRVLSKNRKRKIAQKCKQWFSKNILKHKQNFRTDRANLRSRHSKMMDVSQDRKVTKKVKIKANQQVRVATLNIRGLNQLTKRETLVKILKDNQYKVLLLTETNVNLNSIEYWDGYTAFLSANIEPKIREREQKRRESASIAVANKRPNNRTSHRLDAEFEHAGVGIVMKNCFQNSLQDVKQINGRIATVLRTAMILYSLNRDDVYSDPQSWLVNGIVYCWVYHSILKFGLPGKS